MKGRDPQTCIYMHMSACKAGDANTHALLRSLAERSLGGLRTLSYLTRPQELPHELEKGLKQP